MENFHPITVHFPIALLMAALFTELLAILFRKSWLHGISLWNLGLGVAGAAVAVLTGRSAMATAKHSMEIFQVMQLHERLGYIILVLSASAFLGRLVVRDRLTATQRWTVLLLLGLGCGLMVFSAHLGGRLVYEYGVGGVYGRSDSGLQIIQ